jgi:hypothetical protein
MKKYLILACLCLLALAALIVGLFFLQPAASGSVHIRAGDVTDLRSTSTNSMCEVQLFFTGDAAQDAATVRRVQITVAADDLGNNLVPPKQQAQVVRRVPMLSGVRYNDTLEKTVWLQSPARNATLIKIIKGKAELFSPTAANGGRFTIPNVLKDPDEDIENRALAKYGVQVRIFPRGDESQDFTPTDDIDKAFARRMGGRIVNNPNTTQSTIQFYVNDPDHRVISLNFADGGGHLLQVRGSGSSGGGARGGGPPGEFRNFIFASPPPEDAQLVVELAVPKALRTYPFTVENIPLP